jgi:hypothetical protein
MELKDTLQKPYTDIERADFVVENNHRLGYEIRETETELQAWGMDDNDILIQLKEQRIAENDGLRDTALLRGVTYNNVLFDSDTEQKTNLTAKFLMMSDTDTVTWYGMDNQALLCTKADILAIGQLIEELHSFCWENNAYIKEQIANAETVEEVNAIEINYDRADT